MLTPQKLTREQAAIIGFYTGVLCGPFEDIHKLVEDLAGHPVFTHEIPSLYEELKEKCKPQFLELCAEKEEK